MMRDPAHEKKQFARESYPALREFFPAYLHQDFAEEYSSAADAVKGFLGDASDEEILQVKKEWHALRQAFCQRPLQEIQKAITRLGGAWVPEDEERLKEIDKVLGDAKT